MSHILTISHLLPQGQHVFSMADINWLLSATGDKTYSNRPILDMGHIAYIDGQATLLMCDTHRIHAIPFGPKVMEEDIDWSIPVDLRRIRFEMQYTKSKSFAIEIRDSSNIDLILGAPDRHIIPHGDIWPTHLGKAPIFHKVAKMDDLVPAGTFKVRPEYLISALSNKEHWRERDGVKMFYSQRRKGAGPILFRYVGDRPSWAIVMPMVDYEFEKGGAA